MRFLVRELMRQVLNQLFARAVEQQIRSTMSGVKDWLLPGLMRGAEFHRPGRVRG